MSDIIRIGLTDDEPLMTAGLAMLLGAQADMEVAWQAQRGAQAVELMASDPVDVLLLDVQMPGMDGIETTRRLVSSGVPARIVILTTFDTDGYVMGAIEAGASGFLLKNMPPEELLGAIRSVDSGDCVISPGPTRRLLQAVRTGAASASAPATASGPVSAPTQAFGGAAGGGAGIPAGVTMAVGIPGNGVSGAEFSGGGVPGGGVSGAGLPGAGGAQSGLVDARPIAELTERESQILRLIALGLTNPELCDRLWLSMTTVKTHVSHLLAKTEARDRVQLVLIALRSGLVTMDEVLAEDATSL